jgi:hypothetical protein
MQDYRTFLQKLIMAPPYDMAIFDQNRADGHATFFQALFSLFYGFLHELMIFWRGVQILASIVILASKVFIRTIK